LETRVIDVNPFSTRDECNLLPALVFGAVSCGECNADHGYYLSFGFLFWGVKVLWLKEDGE
jgi:hypothetical protein